MYRLAQVTAYLLVIQARSNTEYYLSVSGSDTWDGTSPTNTPGTNTGPWQSFQHAINELRKIRPTNPGREDLTRLSILGGTYFLDKTVYMNHQDDYLEIVAYNDEDVIISGGYYLDTEWEESGGIRSTTFLGSCSQPFIGGPGGNERLLLARSPNMEWGHNKNIAEGPYHTITDLLVETESCHRDATGYAQSCPEEDRSGFVLRDELSADWDYLDQTQILVFFSWVAEFAKVANITDQGGKKVVMFQQPLKEAPIGNFISSSGWRFLVFNNLAVLDSPGEYVCVEDKDQATLSYIPPLGAENEPIIMSSLEVLLQLGGVTGVTFQGINFEHSEKGDHDGYNYGNQAAVRIQESSLDISFKDCKFSHIGMIGIYVINSAQILIENSVFYDIGYHGILTQFRNVNQRMKNIVIRNNQFVGCGNTTLWQPGCILVEGFNNISVTNNEISNTPYMGIGIRGIMPHGDQYWADNGVTDPTRDDYVFHIEFNYIHDYGKGILSDFGGVYIGASGANCDSATEEELRKNCYTYVHFYNNLLHDSNAFHNDANFLYSDTSSCRNTFENNIMFGAGEAALYHHCGLDNVAKNNIIHRSGEEPLEYMWAGCGKSTKRFQSYSNSHNIYFLEHADGLNFGRSWDRFYDEAPDFHHNLYWSNKEEDRTKALFPDKLSWDEWISTGNDSASLWADPLFLDPSSGQYILSETSPAWGLGIQQIRLDNFGVQGNIKYNIGKTCIEPTKQLNI